MKKDMRADFLLINAGQLVTVAGNSDHPKRGDELSEIAVITDGAVAARDGVIAAVGTTSELQDRVELEEDAVVIDAQGKVVLPGLVDPHTHVVFAGSREHELEMKIQGMPYLEILARGGGILDTVRSTREASCEDLVRTAAKYLDEMLAQGTTTAEAKSGYGLTLKDELKMLEAIRVLQETQPVDLVPTFLGAHAIPEEYKDDPDGFVDLVIQEMLPAISPLGLARFCDVFCEEGVFSVEQTRRILLEAKRLGFELKIHADEMVTLGGAELAAELGATSADHLMMISDQGIEMLAASETIAVLLPATTFCVMGERYAPARKMIEKGAAVALSSDFNPGSSPVNSLQIVMGIACRQLKMTPAEVISAVTINAAHAIGCASSVGSIEEGKRADLVIFDAQDYRYLMYRFGTNLVDKVVKSGRIVVGG
ncbi:imidazolonepropionase [Syntrophaceticus schinkii]|jgi:imidazolonepropionase|uniref:Imidazolonepropionase n=1 Tax=Syntrophaceticus schinkii TaxID=499207 RepID=A0A0B7MGC8_9FIRM|nr:imidazolonepropionase [Syntrophaceticus schinkii]MDD2359380.1 imidazolonepropionase [Syntrophaceticus schinkii]MDD4261245.1 imidazolonepropionase [Syntrophaceticus schinkii]MDD4674421.1 imidazolonepropionase [Syntrophaceticus schinkii]CEO89679.1 imidazolone-5-propionate hydrolase [Syntrophaceticus schinkii]